MQVYVYDECAFKIGIQLTSIVMVLSFLSDDIVHEKQIKDDSTRSG